MRKIDNKRLTESELRKKLEEDIKILHMHFPLSHRFQVENCQAVKNHMMIEMTDTRNNKKTDGVIFQYVPDVKAPPYGTPVEIEGNGDPSRIVLVYSRGEFSSGEYSGFKPAPLLIAERKDQYGLISDGGHAFKWRTIGGEWVGE